MDAVKFLEEAKRMCESYEECEACPANADGFNNCRIDHMHDIDAEGAVTLDYDDAEQIWALLLDYKDLLMAVEVG